MEEKTLPKLLVNMEVAEKKIQERINKGQTFLNRQIDSEDELEISGKEANNWSRYNIDLLIRLFDDLSLKDEYQNFYYSKLTFDEIDGMAAMGWGVPDLDYLVVEYKRDMVGSIKSLEGIRDRLELFSEFDPPERTFGDKIFIVHGHDETAKHKLDRFIENLDLTATILEEQPSKGQTIIDKFEEHADEAGFAIVLLTADDVGAPEDRTDESKPRARQNVILELGYFLRGLGRDRVRILYEEGVELPSDIYGISYVPMDRHGAWRLELAQEMASVGITVDMNKLLPNR